MESTAALDGHADPALAPAADRAGRDRGDPARNGRTTAAAVAYWHRQDPHLHPAEVAERIGRSERTVRRYWPPITP